MSRPQCNEFIEHFDRTLSDEHLSVEGRTTWREVPPEDEIDPHACIENRDRPHGGRGMAERIPHRLLKKGIRRSGRPHTVITCHSASPR